MTVPPAALREVPTMPGIPVPGSALDFQRRMLPTLLRAQHEVGDVVRCSIGPPGARISIHSVFAPEAVGRVLGADETWLRQKRFLQPLFTHAQVGRYVPAMAEEAGAFVELIDGLVADRRRAAAPLRRRSRARTADRAAPPPRRRAGRRCAG